MLRTWSVPLIASSLLSWGCTYNDHDQAPSIGPAGGGIHLEEDPAIATSTIEPGAYLEDIFPGEGTGLYIEYEELESDDGYWTGYWYVHVSCDTAISGYACTWDVLATPHRGYVTFVEDLLEYDDFIGWEYDYSVRMVADNAYDLDGFVMETDPGVPVRFDILLDGSGPEAQRYVYWVGAGALHGGAPTNPIDIVPEVL